MLTGFAGLVYEVSWQRYLAVLLGSHSEATAAVLAIFLGGLASGQAVFGRVSRRIASGTTASFRARLLVLYGCAEAAVGLHALAFPALFGGARALAHLLPAGHEALAFGFDVALAAVLVGPAALLMGATIPLLSQALARDLAHATRIHAFVYACNTAGAFAGALAAGFWLIAALGLEGVVRAMGLVDLAAGLAFLLLSRRAPTEASPAVAPAGPRAPVEGNGLFVAVAALTGFAMMTFQTVLIRLGGLSFGASQLTFALVVAAFVACIALGGFAVSALPRIPRAVVVGNQWALVFLLVLLYPLLGDVTYWAHVLRTLFRDAPEAFLLYQANAFLALLVVLGLPVTLSGAVLPLLFHHLRRRPRELGALAGRLYAWNTAGAVAGALLGGYLLLLWLDLHEVNRVALSALALAAALLAVGVYRVGWLTAFGLLLAPLLIAVWRMEAWPPERLSAGLFRVRVPRPHTYAGPDAFFARELEKRSLLFHDDDPVATVAVLDFQDESGRISRAITVDGKPDGSLVHDYPTAALLALLPALLAERCERSFVVGFGTGVTAGELAELEGSREVVVAEISRAVLDAAPLFDVGNRGASRSPELRLVRGDAYRTLLRSPGAYDLIVSEPSNPWMTGVEMLYSRELLEAARSKLAPGGVFAQWLHTYSSDDESVSLVLRTFASVFDRIAVWYGLGVDLIVLGFADADAEIDLARLAARAAREDFARGLERAGVRDLPALLAHEILPYGAIDARTLAGPVHTLLHPRLAHRAARAFFRGGQGRVPELAQGEPARRGTRASLLRRLARAEGGRLPPEARRSAVEETCRHRVRECAAMIAQWLHDEPESLAAQDALDRAREDPELARVLAPERLEVLVRLFGTRWPEEAVTPEEAREAARLYAYFYHHAAPFRAAALDSLWRRCEQGPGQAAACRAEREALERLALERAGGAEAG